MFWTGLILGVVIGFFLCVLISLTYVFYNGNKYKRKNKDSN